MIIKVGELLGLLSQNGFPGNGGGYSYYRTGPVDYSPEIIEITDVPDDQGGRVFVSFKRSMVDNDLHPHGIDTLQFSA